MKLLTFKSGSLVKTPRISPVVLCQRRGRLGRAHTDVEAGVRSDMLGLGIIQ